MSKSRDTVENLRTVLVAGDVTNANFTGADLDIAKGGTGASSAGAARTALGLAIGTDVLAYDATILVDGDIGTTVLAPNGSGANLTGIETSSTLGTLTKSFLANESSEITLSSTVSPTPVVGVTKEVASQVGVSSKGAWDVSSTGNNYDLQNTATSVTLTPSSATTDGTFTLGSGSFAADDIGKRITGNNGEAIITSTGGAYVIVTSFTNTNTIASGYWQMYALNFDANKGVVLGKSESTSTVTLVDVFNDSSAISLHQLDDNLTDSGGSYTASGSSATWSSSVKKYGTHAFSTGSNASFIIPYNQPESSAWSVSFWFIKNGNTGMGNNHRMVDFKENTSSNGTTISWESDNKFHFILRNNSGGYGSISLGNINDNNWHHIVCGSQSNNGQNPFVYVDKVVKSNGGSYGRSDSHEGTGIQFGHGYGGATPSAGFDQVRIFNKAISSTEVNSLYEEGSLFLHVATAKYHPAITNVAGKIDSTYWTDINTMTTDQINGNGTVSYAVSTDNHTTWKIAKNGVGIRSIAKNNSGTWQYNSNGTYGSETWTNGTTNTELDTIYQALNTTAANVMLEAQLEAVTDPNHFALGTTLDLMIAPYMATASASLPSSDGVSINYDAAALNKGAILGTDYDYDFPASNKVRITSLASQNLKVRVV